MPDGMELSPIPRWGWMWIIAVSLYGGLKVLSWLGRRSGPVPTWRHVAYLFAWPGMDVDTFLNPRNEAVKAASVGEWVFAGLKLALGVGLLACAMRFSIVPPPDLVQPGTLVLPPTLVGAIGMVGIVFVLHFGLFHLLACLWRRCGLQATPIMNWPIVSTTLAEFWGRRWNLAFRDLTHRFVFEPGRRRLGTTGALLASFVASGLIHEVAISVPAGAGFGLPTLYFVIQGVAAWFQRTRFARSLGLCDPFTGRIFTAGVLLAPIGGLLHAPFAQRVIVRFLQSLSLGLGLTGS